VLSRDEGTPAISASSLHRRGARYVKRVVVAKIVPFYKNHSGCEPTLPRGGRPPSTPPMRYILMLSVIGCRPVRALTGDFRARCVRPVPVTRHFAG
jgi:hypothetical protein